MKSICVCLVVLALVCFSTSSAQTCPRLRLQPPQIVRTPARERSASLFMGHYVKADGEWMAAGAYGDDSYTGAVFVYRLVDSQWRFHQKIVPRTKVRRSYFGLNVHVCGNVLVVGYPFYPTQGQRDRGAIEIFELRSNRWRFLQMLTAPAPDGHVGAYYGYGAACHRDVIVVGARYQDYLRNGSVVVDRAGAAYVYERSGARFAFVQTLRQRFRDAATDSFWGDEVRVWVSTSPEIPTRVLVGASRDNPSNKGSASVFEKRGSRYLRVQNLRVINSPGTDEHYGEGLSINDDTIVMGGERAHNSFTEGSGSGGGNSVVYKYIPSRGRFVPQQRLEPNRGGGLFFAQRLHQHEGLICVSAWGSNEAGGRSGSAYCYVQCSDGAWTLAQKFVAPDNQRDLKFGKCIHVDADYIYVGAPERARNAPRQGAVYAYRYSL